MLPQNCTGRVSVVVDDHGGQRLFLFRPIRAVETIKAYVKPTNKRSLELFRSAGFEDNGECEIGGHCAVRFGLRRCGADE